MPGRADVQTSISEGRTVAAVMLTNPKTLPASATVADTRSLFENPRVQTALIVEGSRFLGALDRDQIPEDALGTRLALDYSQAELHIVSPDLDADQALELLDKHERRRLVVLEPDGETLAGLLCLSTTRTSFCTDTTATPTA
jgi:CBS domain-containing protein